MVSGSRSDIGAVLRLAKRLETRGHRIRIATHSAYRDLVHKQEFEFHDVGGCPNELSQSFGRGPGWLWSMIRGDVGRLRRTLFSMFVRFWQAGFDADSPGTNGDDVAGCKGQDAVKSRPFMAGLVVSVPSTTVHIHAVESLRCPR
jgi:hypothetical protein